MYVEYTALDNADPRFYLLFPYIAYRHSGKYAARRFVGLVSDVLLPMELHATLHQRNHDCRPTDTDRLRTAYQNNQEVPALGHRLVGGHIVGCAYTGNYLYSLAELN